jgi:hypothetical protein
MQAAMPGYALIFNVFDQKFWRSPRLVAELFTLAWVDQPTFGASTSGNSPQLACGIKRGGQVLHIDVCSETGAQLPVSARPEACPGAGERRCVCRSSGLYSLNSGQKMTRRTSRSMR